MCRIGNIFGVATFRASVLSHVLYLGSEEALTMRRPLFYPTAKLWLRHDLKRQSLIWSRRKVPVSLHTTKYHYVLLLINSSDTEWCGWLRAWGPWNSDYFSGRGCLIERHVLYTSFVFIQIRYNSKKRRFYYTCRHESETARWFK